MMTSESERLTRRQRIDPRVTRAGWTRIVPFRPDLSLATLSATAGEEYETANGPADYALRRTGARRIMTRSGWIRRSKL